MSNFFFLQCNLICSLKPMWNCDKNAWYLWNCFIKGMSKKFTTRKSDVLHTSLYKETIHRYFSCLCWEQSLTTKFTSSTSRCEKMASVSSSQLKSIRPKTRSTISVSTVFFLLYDFLELFHSGAHGKKTGVHRIWTIFLSCCWKNVHWQALGWNIVQDSFRIFAKRGFFLSIQLLFSY